MKITHYGHACFSLTLADGRVIATDPYGPIGYPRLPERADVVTVSHGHHDHNFTQGIAQVGRVADTEAGLALPGITISAMASWHDDANGEKRGRNLLFMIEADGLRAAHLGDLGHAPSDKQLAFLENLDVLMLPIGGFYTIDTPTAASIVQAVRPKLTIAMHYLTDAIQFPISTEQEFLRLLDGKALPTCQLDTDDAALPAVVALDYMR